MARLLEPATNGIFGKEPVEHLWLIPLAIMFFGIGDRPASDDGVLVAPGFTQFDAHLGYRQRWFDVAFDVENLFNGVFRSAQFDTVSRLRSEPGVGQPTPTGHGGRAGPAGTAAEQDGKTPELPCPGLGVHGRAVDQSYDDARHSAGARISCGAPTRV